ncbi:MAG: hypothetical protein IIZ61_06555 [Lachnospiraceae bacterium]|nr:hypothetical protein [Lachnospiraceae bacterium]
MSILKRNLRGRHERILLSLALFFICFFLGGKTVHAQWIGAPYSYSAENISLSAVNEKGIPWWNVSGKDFLLSYDYVTRGTVYVTVYDYGTITVSDGEGGTRSYWGIVGSHTESRGMTEVSRVAETATPSSVSPGKFSAEDYGEYHSFSASSTCHGISVSGNGSFRVRGPMNESELTWAGILAKDEDKIIIDDDIFSEAESFLIEGKALEISGNGVYGVYRTGETDDPLFDVKNGSLILSDITADGSRHGTSGVTVKNSGGILSLKNALIKGGLNASVYLESGITTISGDTKIYCGTDRESHAVKMGNGEKNATLFFKDGTIYGGNGTGCVSMYRGTFEMSGGAIDAFDPDGKVCNTTTGVNIGNYGGNNVFRMKGGVIKNAHEGVITEKGQSMELIDGTISTGRIADGVGSDAACIVNKGKVSISGGSLVLCCKESGVGVLNLSGELSMSDGTIISEKEKFGTGILNLSDSVAKISGGTIMMQNNGIYQDSTGNVLIGEGGVPEIKDCKVSGIALASGNVFMNGGTVSHNGEEGVYISPGTKFYQSGGTVISNNKGADPSKGIHQAGEYFLSGNAVVDENNSICLERGCVITIPEEGLNSNGFFVGFLHDDDNFVGRTVAVTWWDVNEPDTQELRERGERYANKFTPDFFHPHHDSDGSDFTGCVEESHYACIRPGTCGSKMGQNILYLSGYYSAFYGDFPIKDVNAKLPEKECFLWKEEKTFKHTDIQEYPVTDIPEHIIMKGWTYNPEYETDEYKYLFDTLLSSSLGDPETDYPEEEKYKKYYDREKTLLQKSDIEFSFLSGNFSWYPVFDIKQDIRYLGGDSDTGETVKTVPSGKEEILQKDVMPKDLLWDYRDDSTDNFYRRSVLDTEENDYSNEGWSFVRDTVLSDTPEERMKYEPGIFTYNNNGNMFAMSINDYSEDVLTSKIKRYDTDLYGLSFYAEGVRYDAADKDVLLNGEKPVVTLYSVWDRFPYISACEISIDTFDIESHDEEWMVSELLRVPEQIYSFGDRETEESLLKISLDDFDYSHFINFRDSGDDMGSVPVTYRIEDTAKGPDKEGNVTYYTVNVTITSSTPLRSKEVMYGKKETEKGIVECRFINRDYYEKMINSGAYKNACNRGEKFYYTKDEYEEAYELYKKGGALHPYSKWYTNKNLKEEMEKMFSDTENGKYEFREDIKNE